MIYIRQNKGLQEQVNECNKLDIQSIRFSKEQLKLTIERAQRLKGKIKNKTSRDNVGAMEKHIKRIMKELDEDGTMEICWSERDGVLSSYPIDIVDEEDYKLRMTDSILTVDKKLVKIKYSNIREIMAFKYIYRELGYDLNSIEEIMANIGISGVCSSEKLMEELKKHGGVYNNAFSMVVRDSPYANTVKGEISGYFTGEKYVLKKGDTYGNIVRKNCKEVLSIIALETLKKCSNNGMRVELVSVDERTVTMMVDSKEDVSRIVEQVSLRAFGRQLLIEADVTVI